jgi:hypothetical protein
LQTGDCFRVKNSLDNPMTRHDNETRTSSNVSAGQRNRNPNKTDALPALSDKSNIGIDGSFAPVLD